jgi:CRISPR-associated RAMP protein (TIGR02581 family)
MGLIRYTFIGKLELTGALHIGSGGGGTIGKGAATDATVVRDNQGRPYIPGSSLRGVLRAAVAQYGAALFADTALATLREDDAIERAVRPVLAKAAEERRQQANPSPLDEEAIQNLLAKELLPAERLFGTVFWASPLLIPDLRQIGAEALAGEVRHGVGIDRDTGAARDQVKYDFEALPQGHRFGLWMRCEIPDTHEGDWTRLLALALRLLEQGELTLGGRIARGLGQVRLVDLKVYRLELARSTLLAALLAEDQTGRFGTAQPEGWARSVLAAEGAA